MSRERCLQTQSSTKWCRTYQRRSAWAADWGLEEGCVVWSFGWRSVYSDSSHRSSDSLHRASPPERWRATHVKTFSDVFFKLDTLKLFWCYSVFYILHKNTVFFAGLVLHRETSHKEDLATPTQNEKVTNEHQTGNNSNYINSLFKQ